MARMKAPEQGTSTVEVGGSGSPSATTTTRSRPCSSSSSSSSMTEPPSPSLIQLARQVEYYFSVSNLTTDTYIRTLRSLNDGYVPMSIIANFAKVLAIIHQHHLHQTSSHPNHSSSPPPSQLLYQNPIDAVRTACTEYSELLETVYIDRNTSKRVTNETARSLHPEHLIQAVGPIGGGDPIPDSQIVFMKSTSSHSGAERSISSAPSTESEADASSSSDATSSSHATKRTSNAVQNTIVLRDVPSKIQEKHIRALFDFDKCPPIQSLRLDVASCW